VTISDPIFISMPLESEVILVQNLLKSRFRRAPSPRHCLLRSRESARSPRHCPLFLIRSVRKPSSYSLLSRPRADKSAGRVTRDPPGILPPEAPPVDHLADRYIRRRARLPSFRHSRIPPHLHFPLHMNDGSLCFP
jgi:hypothetical protein